MKEEYYYQQMNKAQKAVYYAMYEGFGQILPGFFVPRLDGRELTDIFFRLRLDHPEIFYVNTFTYRFTAEAEYVQMIPEYMFENKKIREHQKALEGRIARLVRGAEAMDVWEKEKYVHDFICNNVTYDKLKKQYSHEIIGPLTAGVGVCEGIAKTVKILCNRLGLDCIIAVSGANKEKGIKYRHAWNIVKIQGSWYHMDATFDNSLGRYGAKRFDYLNLCDREIFRDHEPLLYSLPPCTQDGHCYYREKRLSLTKVEDVGRRLGAVLRKKQDYFVFQWRGGGLNRELLARILEAAAKEAALRGKYVHMSMNPGQLVIELSLINKKDDGGICVEAANEGELLDGKD